METIDVALPDDLQRFVDAKVASGGYGGASDFICSLIARAKEGHERIEALLVEGLDSGDPILLNDVEWESIRREVHDNLAE